MFITNPRNSQSKLPSLFLNNLLNVLIYTKISFWYMCDTASLFYIRKQTQKCELQGHGARNGGALVGAKILEL